MKGMRFVWRCTRVEGELMLFKEFIDDGTAYDDYRGEPDRGWWTGEERWVPRTLFHSGASS